MKLRKLMHFIHKNKKTRKFLGSIRLALSLMLLCCTNVVLADSWENTQYNTTEGSEFYITTMKNGGLTAEDVFSVYMYATARKATYICITNDDGSYKKIIQIPARGQAGCNIPVSYIYSDATDDNMDAAYSDTRYIVTKAQDKSLLVYTCNANGVKDTTSSVSVYITSYHWTAGFEATNVLPVKALEREYMVQTYLEDSYATEFAVVATEDNQVFEVVARLRETVEDRDTLICDTVFQFTCNKGQTRVLRCTNALHSLSGSYVCSDSKFGLINGNQSAVIPIDARVQNHIFEQNVSTDKWGRNFVVTPTAGHIDGVDHVLLTAIEDGTVIKKNSAVLTTLQSGETFLDEVVYQNKNYNAPYYSSNKPILCYLYETGDGNKDETGKAWGVPSMTMITPLEMGVNSIMVAAFNATKEDLGLPRGVTIDEQYINIVTRTEYAKSIYIDNENNKITGFRTVAGNPAYSYVLYKLKDKKPHLIGCTNPNGTFTIRLYGHSKSNSYSYVAGSRVNRAVDMLINDKYIRYLRICLNDKVKFTPLIDFEYDRDNTKWIIGDDVIPFTSLGDDGIVKNYQFDTTGLYDVYLVVQSYTPLCEKTLIDTIHAQIEVDDLSYKAVAYDPCYGDEFELQHKGQQITFKADTSLQYWEGQTFRFAVGVPKVFADTIPATTEDECDLVLRQVVTVRPVYKDTFDTTACDVWYWEHEENGKIDTVYTFRVNPGDKLPVTKEHTIRFGTRYYDCDSIVTWRVTLNKSYSFVEDSIICQDLSGQLKYIWTDHDTIDIPIDKVGTFTYVDHLKTKHEPYCDSIHTLRLKVVPSYDSTEVVTICQNESFTWSVNGKRYVGNKFSNIQSTDVVLNNLNETIIFVETFETDAFGCDSIHRLEIMVYPSYDTTYVKEICDNQIYELNDTIAYYGNKYKADGLAAQAAAYKFDHFFKTTNDCDSIVRLELYVHPTYEIITDTAVCQQEGEIFIWNNHTSFFSINLNKQVTTIPIDQPGTYQYIDSQVTSKDCDSIHILNITVYPTYFASQDTVLSNEDKIEWEELLIAGKDARAINPDYVVTKDTAIQVRYDSKDMCDSILLLNIKFGEVFRDTTYGVACDNDKIYHWYWDNNGTKQYLKDVEVPTVASVYEFTEKRKSSIGVDSLFYLYLTVNPTYYIETVASICEGNQYIWKVKDANGDSVKITEPIFDEQNNKLISPLDIPTILADNNDSPQTFRYTYHLKTVACATCPPEGCDSVYSLVLTILPQYDHTDTLAMCDNDSLQWNGEWFYGYKTSYTSPIKGDTLITREYENDHGCLSYKRLQLILRPSYLYVASIDTTYKHICENEKYETSYGKVYNANGEWDTPDGVVSRYVVIDTIETKACASCYDTDLKCDSVVASVVYVYPTYQYVTYDVICQNDNYQWVVRDQNGDSINVIRDNIYDAEDRLVNGIPTDQHGQFEYRYYTQTCEDCSNSVRCDSTHILYLTILPRANTVETLWMCDNDSVYWARTDKWFYGDKVPNASGVTYTSQKDPYCIVVPASNAYGCDYEEILYLYVRPSYAIDSTVHICDNQLFKLNDTISYYGNLYKADGLVVGEYHYTHKFRTTDCSDCADKGCDSIINLTLHVHKTYSYIHVDTICKDEGNYSWQIVDPLNGDTTIVNGMIRDENNQTDISALNIPKNELGTFIYTYKTLSETCDDCPNMGCDSVWTLNLTVIDGYAIHKEIHMCDNDTALWNNQLYVGSQFAGTYDPTLYTSVNPMLQGSASYVYYDTIPGVSKYGCDSTHFLELYVHPTYLQPVRVDTIDKCDNEIYTFYGTVYNTAGEWHTGKDTTQYITLNYTDTTINGCDSVVMHVICVHPTFKDPIVYDTICHSALPYNYADPLATNLQGLTQSGIYVDTLVTINGCDSIITLSLTVNPSTTNRVFKTWCYSSGPYTYDSIETPKLCNLTQSGVYVDTLQTTLNLYGCDSIIELHLTVVDSIVTYIHEDICDNELPYNHPNILAKNLLNLTKPGIYKDTLVSINGCDSVLVLDLQVHPTYKTTDTVRICDNENPYIWITEDSNGQYVDTIHYQPSTIYIDTITSKPKKDIITINNYSRTLSTINGCDSIVDLSMTIYPSYFFLTVDTACSGEVYKWRNHKKSYETSVIVTDSFKTEHGCDSIYQLDLHIKPTNIIHSFDTICDNQTLYHESQDFVVWEPGMSEEDLLIDLVWTNIYGCDSIMRYHVVLGQTYSFDTTGTICSNDTFMLHKHKNIALDIPYYKPGTHVQPIDTIITDTLKTIGCPSCPGGGCDSVFNAYLRILPAYKHIDKDTICSGEPYIWRGDTIIEDFAGIYKYYDSFTTVMYSCDSIYELQLTVHQSYDTMLPPVTICADEYYQIGDSLYNESGIYNIVLNSIHGCDSIVNTELIVLDTTNLFIKDTICVTEKYILDTLYSNYRIFTEQGFYKDTSTNEWGCKHFTYLDLTIIDTTKYTIEIGDICADEDEILVYYQYEGHPLIEYSVIFDEYGKSQGFEDIYHAPLDSTLSFFSIPIPKGEMLPHPEPTYFDSQQGVNDYTYEDKFAYPQPNKYTMTVIMHNGICGDTLQRKDTTMNIKYPSWIHEQHWNDAVVLYNETYNGGYEFSHYQWYQNGEPIIGATKEYLYLPDRLLMNRPGDCENYYQVMLTRKEDGYSTLTCPICPVEVEDTIVPRLDYYSIVPTQVVKENPVVHILSTLPGTYKVFSEDGKFIREDSFVPDINKYAGPIPLDGCPSGRVIIKLFLNNNGVVETRVTKVIIK